MGLLARVIRETRSEQSFLTNPAQWLVDMFGGRASATGQVVTPATAIGAPAVLAAVSALSRVVANLPLHVYVRDDQDRRRKALDHALYPLLHRAPNPEITSFEWRELAQTHVMLWGNAYAEVVRNGAGRVTALWPWTPDRVRVERDSQGQLIYWLRLPRLGTTGASVPEVPFLADRVWHLRGFSLDGVLGVPPTATAREAIGLTLAVEEYGARFFGQGTTPGGTLEHPGRLGPAAVERLKASWDQMHTGTQNSHRVAILEEGMKFNALQIQNEHAQFLETRKFQVADVARVFGLPPHMVGDLERATFSNIEHQGIEFVRYTLGPWCGRWEQRSTLALLTPSERQRYYVEHDLGGILRGDRLAQVQAYREEIMAGISTINEVRRLDNRDPIGEQGDVHWMQAQMTPLERLISPPIPAPVPPELEPEPEPDDAPPPPDAATNRWRRAYTRLLDDAIERAIRREIEAVRKAHRQHGANAGAWREWVDHWYSRHAAYLSEALKVDLDRAQAWIWTHRAALLAEGVAVLTQWETEAPAALRHLVDGEG